MTPSIHSVVNELFAISPRIRTIPIASHNGFWVIQIQFLLPLPAVSYGIRDRLVCETGAFLNEDLCVLLDCRYFLAHFTSVCVWYWIAVAGCRFIAWLLVLPVCLPTLFAIVTTGRWRQPSSLPPNSTSFRLIFYTLFFAFFFVVFFVFF